MAAKLLAVALIAWSASAYYSVRLHPEMVFLRSCHDVKQSWKQTLASKHRPKIVVYGGSSCLTSINGERMEKLHGLSVLNLGFHAGMGARVLSQYSLPAINPGDTLIVALEPDLLAGSVGPTPMGVQFCFATARLDALRNPDHVQWASSLLALRPGSENIFTMIGKIAFHQPLHRYSMAEIHQSGWQEIIDRRAFAAPLLADLKLSIEARELLREIHNFCAQHRVRVAYSLPWNYCTPETTAEHRRQNRIFLHQISEVLPVLDDPRLGAYDVRADFADTPWHLTAKGAVLRSDELAQQIIGWRVMSFVND